MNQALQRAKLNNYSEDQLSRTLKKLFLPEESNNKPDISSISEIKSSDVVVPEPSRTLDEFFRKRDA